jgi:hypothetical protein
MKVYEVTSVSIAPRVVPTGLYRRAVSLLGDELPQLHERTHPRVDPVLTIPKATETAQ